MNVSLLSDQSSAALPADNVEASVSNPDSQDSLQNSQKRTLLTAAFQRFDSGTDSDRITPSTSYSTYSSQENVISGGNGGTENAHGTNATKHDGYSPRRDTATSAIHTEQASGLKRTATGQIKSPSSASLPPSPVDSYVNGHSRNTSTTSRGSRIAEMSSKLHARLSYAKVKVDHGWEGHNINELERMTSAQASPLSASSYTAANTTPSIYSPVGYSPVSQLRREASTSIPPQYHNPIRQFHTESLGPGQLSNGLATPTAEMLNSQRNETYEQFWQAHSNPALSSAQMSGAQASNGRSLAPPVDFSPRERSSNKQNSLSSTSNRISEQVPSTPPARASSLAKRRTSNEQDALEGLLSMNSPANSQNRSTNRPLQQIPLQRNATEPSLLLNGVVNSPSVSLTDPAQSIGPLRVLNDDELNNMLDNMPDSSSDEDVMVQRQLPPVLGS